MSNDRDALQGRCACGAYVYGCATGDSMCPDWPKCDPCPHADEDDHRPCDFAEVGTEDPRKPRWWFADCPEATAHEWDQAWPDHCCKCLSALEPDGEAWPHPRKQQEAD
jgi:hypothetical protein